ncbi:MAG: hypothetical protein O9352_16160 [Rhizobium sp.]|nr:hypothetical protein [Rhizobium sp.]
MTLVLLMKFNFRDAGSGFSEGFLRIRHDLPGGACEGQKSRGDFIDPALMMILD